MLGERDVQLVDGIDDVVEISENRVRISVDFITFTYPWERYELKLIQGINNSGL